MKFSVGPSQAKAPHFKRLYRMVKRSDPGLVIGNTNRLDCSFKTAKL